MQQLATHRENEWAVILAGGDGTRLKSLTREIAGDKRPKQFCSVLGGMTLPEETQRRAALELAHERTLSDNLYARLVDVNLILALRPEASPS
jgi:mannose-1-phosphate guanylyltransferase